MSAEKSVHQIRLILGLFFGLFGGGLQKGCCRVVEAVTACLLSHLRQVECCRKKQKIKRINIISLIKICYAVKLWKLKPFKKIIGAES